MSDSFRNARNFREFRTQQQKLYDHDSILLMTKLLKNVDGRGDGALSNRSQYARARGYVQSRAFVVSNTSDRWNTLLSPEGLNNDTTFPRSLVPFADMMNEVDYANRDLRAKQPLANAAHYVNRVTKAHTFVAVRNITKGEQILSHYTSTQEASCSSVHFATYGYIPHGCHARMTQLKDRYDFDDDEEEEEGAPKTPQKVAVHSEDLVGHRISVYWSKKQAWRNGTVVKYVAKDNEYLIRYDFGKSLLEELSHDYTQEEWRLLA